MYEPVNFDVLVIVVVSIFFCPSFSSVCVVSPYLKSLSMVTSARLLHLMESFSTPWFLFAKPSNHFLIFYLLEIFNNIIQYQFDGELKETCPDIRSRSY